MFDQIFSWSTLLTIVGLTGFWLAGKKVWWCWYINIACQGLWFTYAIVTEQYAFIAASLAYTYVFTQNAISWTKAHKANSALRDKITKQFSTYAGSSILEDACLRFHPNQPCRPGDNHPAVGGS